jgi:hypothetical protein
VSRKIERRIPGQYALSARRLWSLKDLEPVRALLFYILFISVFYAPVTFTGKSLQPSLYQPHGIVEGWASGGRRPVNSFNVDLATPSYYEWPINKLVGDIYKRGELPLWNPYQGAGTPLAAQYSTRAFFPYQILEDISPVWTWDFFILGRLLIAGFFSYLFLTTLGLSFPSAFLGGLFYMFSGTFVWFINLEQMSNTAMMLPVVMYTVELLARHGGSSYTVATAASFALLFLAGQPEVALYITLLAVSFFLFRTISLNKHFFRFLLKFSAAFFLGLALSAPLIFPFLELVGKSHHIHPIGGPMGIQILQNWKSIFAIFTPSSTVFPSDPEMVKGLTGLVKLDGSFFRYLPTNGVWDSLGGYTGILTVFFVIFALSIIFKNIGIRPFLWLGYLPLFDQVWSLRWAGPVWTFAISAAGAIGLETICSNQGGCIKTSGTISSYFDEKPYMAAVFSFLILFGLYVAFPLLPTLILVVGREEFFNANMEPFAVPSMLGGTMIAVLVMACGFMMAIYCMRKKTGNYGIIALCALELWWAVPRGYDPMWLILKWVPFSIGLLMSFLFLKEKLYRAFFGGLFFLVSFLFLDVTSPHGFPEKSDPFRPAPSAPYVDFLKNRPGMYRSVGAYGVLFPNFASSVNSLTPKTYHDYRTRYLHMDIIDEEPVSSLWFTGRPERCMAVRRRDNPGHICETFLRSVEEDIGERLPGYSLLGVKYIILPKAHDMSGFPLIYDKEVRIYENPFALDRAFVANEIRKAGSYEEAQEMTLGEGFDPKKTVVIEEKVPPGFGSGNGSSVAVIREYRPNRVVVEVDAQSEGVLVLSDVYYPGWRVKVNGEERRLLRVDGLIRGVFVEKGRSVVEFRYLPLGFLVGSIISLCAVLVCGLLLYIKHGRSSS